MASSSSLLVAGGGTITSLLASSMVYLTHWPLQPLTDEEALNFAGLIVLLGGMLSHILVNLWERELPENPTQPAGDAK